MKWTIGEFMDQSWVPDSLHATLRDVLGFHLRLTLGYYYRWAAAEALAKAKRLGASKVVELGAGSAGFSETLARMVRDRGEDLTVEISDLHPQPARYRELEQMFPGIVSAHVEPLNFLTRTEPSPTDIVVFSAAFHHIPKGDRHAVLAGMRGRRVLIFESVTRNLPSIFGCAVGFLPAMLTPLYFLGTAQGRWRRFVWCWLLPVAPLMVAWDGVVSCVRCWTEDEWRSELARLGIGAKSVTIERRRFSHMIGW